MEDVLEALVGERWRLIEDELLAGRISHTECLRRQIALVGAPRAEFLHALIAAAQPLPGFAGFLASLQARGGRGAVVSAGLRAAIEAFWRREALPHIDVFASDLVSGGPDGAPPHDIVFSSALGNCPRCGPGGCKGAVLRALRRHDDTVIVFGDGAADLCMAREADLTFARGYLAERCARDGLDWRPLGDYVTVWRQVDAWLAARRAERRATSPAGF